MYWWWQGAVLTGLWVIAHECGEWHMTLSCTIIIIMSHVCSARPHLFQGQSKEE